MKKQTKKDTGAEELECEYGKSCMLDEGAPVRDKEEENKKGRKKKRH